MSLKPSRSISIPKSDIGFDTPRSPFGRVNDTARVVMFETRPQITGTEPLGTHPALKNVDIEEFDHGRLAES